ncbi:FeoA family protein [Proteocatella sphenisci]|uniref:FeoA family protein n=1 Tax=Proteocatella sphenisci TaxID=181070 RepID=UPI00048C889E|nr:FeoA family protein [Proteocatella sphenisci]
MPLAMVRIGEISLIDKINGKDSTKKFLENLGFVAGEWVTIISELGGNIIVSVKNTRIAIDKSMAQRIIVQRR